VATGAEFLFRKVQLIGEFRRMGIMTRLAFLVCHRLMYRCFGHLRFEIGMAFETQIGGICFQQRRMPGGMRIMALRTLAGFQRSVDALAVERFAHVFMALETDLRLVNDNLLRESTPG